MSPDPMLSRSLTDVLLRMRSDCSVVESIGQAHLSALTVKWLPTLEAFASGPVVLPDDYTGPASGPADLTVAQVAARYDRHPSTVRGWCESGVLRGAYRLRGREWRVPAETLAAFEQAERGARRPDVQHSGRRTPVDLGSWRKEA